MISKRILEIYASRNTVVNGNYNAIPITINKHVQKEIDHYTTGNGRIFFIESYKRSGGYRPKMVAALREAGLPASLSWLPLIESGFKIRALSSARALGLWQFIPSTGYKFGLKRNMYIDERLDPEKATRAAVSYLKELHQIFGDWTTVLAAYNCGEGRVLRIIRSQNVNYLDNFWDLYEKLPRETARYVPKFLATLHIVNNLDKYGLDPMVTDSPMDYQTIEISKQVSLKDIADKIGVSKKLIADLNPELRHKILPPDSYPLKIPPEKKDMLIAAIDEIPVTSPPRSTFVYHRVRRGQTLSTIAKRYKTTIGRIARANNINRRNYIVAGKLLKIPLPGTYASKAGKHAKASQHIVKRGDSLWLIAKRYGSTTRKIQKANNLSTTKLHIGQILNIPGYKDNTATLKNIGKYIVKSGDNPFMIAKQHNMSLDQLFTLNHLSKMSKIFPGQELYVNKIN
jgi:membrane-bound lytic murein transglycosylase D